MTSGLLSRAGYFLSKGLYNLRQHLFINLVAIGTIAVSFILIDAALLAYANLGQTLTRWGEKIQVTAYFKDGVDAGRVDDAVKAIAALPGVEGAAFVSKDRALESLRRDMAGMEGFLEGLKFNPLPAYCEITLTSEYRTAERVREIAGAIARMPAVDDVQFGREWVEKFSAFLEVMRLGGIAVGIALLAAVVFIVSNTIKLSLYARREEIEIMKLVGATNFFVRVPFVIEGGLQGLLGATLSILCLYGAYRAALGRMGPPLALFLGVESISFLSARSVLLLLLGGTGLGVLGSATSLGRFVRQG